MHGGAWDLENYEREGAGMFASVTYGDDHLVDIEDDDSVLRVTFNGQDRWECTVCGTHFDEEADADNEECEDRETCVVHTGDGNCDDHDCSFPHAIIKHTEPFAWANDVRIVFDEEKDQVDLAISIGDLLGAFVMRVYRDDRGAIRMEVPHPGKSGLHMPLRYLNEGFYGVGEVAG